MNRTAIILLAVVMIAAVTYATLSGHLHKLPPQVQTSHLNSTSNATAPIMVITSSTTSSTSSSQTIRITASSTAKSELGSQLRLLEYEWLLQGCDPSGTVPQCLQFDIVNTGSTMVKIIAIALMTSGRTGLVGEGVGLTNPIYPNRQTGFSIPVQNQYDQNGNCLLVIPYTLEIVSSTHETFLFTIYCAPPGVWVSIS
jgi:hypothetical protein